MLEQYFPILLFILIGAGLGFLLGPRRPDAEKLSPYECGFEAFEDSRMKFDVRYYLVAILFIIVGLAFSGLLLSLGVILAPSRPDSEKLSPYECGFEAFEDARMKFDVRYYLIAILFILFDLEIAFLFPWAVVLPDIGAFGFWSMMIFLAVLVIGFAYEWKKGALEWD